MKNILPGSIKSWMVLASIGLSIFACVANSLVVSNLYTVETTVADMTPETRHEVLPRTLDEVLMKAASSKLILGQPEVDNAKQNIDKYISSYSYKENHKTGMLDLTIKFNPIMVEQLLSQANQLVVGDNRPVIMLWLVLEQENKVQFIASETHTQLTKEIEHLARNYAIPISLPLLDLAERTAIKEHDVSNHNWPMLKEFAKRYHADMILVGKFTQGSDAVNCEWQLLSDEQVTSWDTASNNIPSQLDEMFEHLGAQIAVRYGTASKNVSAHDNANVMIHIKGVKNIEDYARITAYLKNLKPVRKVEISDIQPEAAVFVLSAEGGQQAITRAIGLDNYLTADANDTGSAANNLFYKVNS